MIILRSTIMSFLLVQSLWAQAPGNSVQRQMQDADERYKTLVNEYMRSLNQKRSGQNSTKDGIVAGSSTGERSPVANMEFLLRFMAVAKEYAGQDAAVPFLIWVVNHDQSRDRKQARGAWAVLLDKHMDSERFISYVSSLGGGIQRTKKETLPILDRIIKESPRAEARAAALLARAKLTAGAFVTGASYKGVSTAKHDLAQAIDEAPGTSVAEDAKNFLFEIEHLQIGMTAPDIEGNDLDGMTFRLSDYRGKVVVLVFWGDW